MTMAKSLSGATMTSAGRRKLAKLKSTWSSGKSCGRTGAETAHPAAQLHPKNRLDESTPCAGLRPFGSPDLLNIAKLSRDGKTGPAKTTDAEAQAPVGTIVRAREKCLVLDLHKRIAVPLLQVTCILEKPPHLTVANRNADGLLGYFSRRGETVVMIDLRERLGAGPAHGEMARVLLAGSAGEQFGFLVDHLVGIEVSQWRSKKPEQGPVLEEPIVKLGFGPSAQTLPISDLAAISGLATEGNVQEGALQSAAG